MELNKKLEMAVYQQWLSYPKKVYFNGFMVKLLWKSMDSYKYNTVTFHIDFIHAQLTLYAVEYDDYFLFLTAN